MISSIALRGEAYLSAVARLHNETVPYANRIVSIEVQRWAWDLAVVTENATRGRLMGSRVFRFDSPSPLASGDVGEGVR